MNLIGTKLLKTERLILRKYKESDAKDMFNNWGSNPNCNIYLPWELHEDIKETKIIIQEWIKAYKEDNFKWIIELKDSEEEIGGKDVVSLDNKRNICEIGYCIGSKFWNNGYTTEALNKVLDFLFNECNLFLIEAYHAKTNIASGKVMQKCGMIKECELRNRAINRKTQELENLVVYSITREEFNKNKRTI